MVLSNKEELKAQGLNENVGYKELHRAFRKTRGVQEYRNEIALKSL